MAKRKEGGRRANLVRCYLTDGEYTRLMSYTTSLNISVSDLIRAKIVYGGMLDVDPVKLLDVFVQIARDIARISSCISETKDHLSRTKEISIGSPIADACRYMMEYQADITCLEKAIRMLLIRMDRKEKML
ncbi:hypothetical protein [Pedobacter psychrodurus]|uniref:hypothetical protein n=1 Tax=Pedobacter psychrodurus TaxID=2530456 RepID=UPI00292CF061|nr:hypothetical protein [Pedobacter psychrodurus]